MGTQNPNQTLLQGAHQSPSDKTPAPLTGPSHSVTFKLLDVAPPSLVYIERDDSLLVSGMTQAGGDNITINVRVLKPNGEIQTHQFVLQAPATHAIASATFAMSEGFLLSVAAQGQVAVQRGVTFVRAVLNRGASGTGQPAYLLFADYVTTAISTGFPFGRVLSPVEGPGSISSVTMANPGAGVDWSIATIGNERWRIRAFTATLTTSATVANRQVQFRLFDPAGNIFFGPPSGNIPATTVAQVSGCAVAVTSVVVATDIAVPIPVDLVTTGQTGIVQSVGVQTIGIQAGDQWSAIRLHVERWLDNV